MLRAEAVERVEGPLVEINNRDDLEAWLRTRPHEVAVTFAARAALRVLPCLWSARDASCSGDIRTDLVLPAFRGTAIVWAVANFRSNRQELSLRAIYGIKAEFSARFVGISAASLACEAVRAAVESVTAHGTLLRQALLSPRALAAATDPTVFASETAAVDAADFAAQAGAALDAVDVPLWAGGLSLSLGFGHAEKDLWSAISIDARRVEDSVPVSVIARSPLWPNSSSPTPYSQPEPIWSLWRDLKRELHAAGQDWQVWTIWYEDRLQGYVRDEKREFAYIQIEDELWRQGPTIVNAEIIKQVESLNAQRTDAKHWANTLANLAEAPLGNRWIEHGDQLTIDPRGNETDTAAALDPVVRQLHEALRRKAIAFAIDSTGIDERLGWTGFEGAIGRFRAAVDIDTAEIPNQIATVYDATIELASFLEYDNDLKERFAGNVTPLDPSTRRAFQDLVRTASPWVRHFPTACKLDDETGTFLARRDLFEPSRTVLEGAGSVSLISGADEERLKALLSAALSDGLQAQKAGNRGVFSAKNLILTSLVCMATSGIAFYSSAVASDFANRSELVKKIGTFLAKEESQIKQIFADAPADIRLAISSLLADLRSGHASDHSSPLSGDQYAILNRRKREEDGN